MKMKKNLRRFFTLDVHNHDGFTLVELIVVIAILAILSGVAVPAYSGYIEKSKRAADEQLLDALNTAYATACMENGEYDMTQLSVNPEASNIQTAVTMSDYNDSFQRYFGGNGAFKYYDSLVFVKATGVFEGFNGDALLKALQDAWKNSNFDDGTGAMLSTLLGAFDGIADWMVIGGDMDLDGWLLKNVSDSLAEAMGLKGMLDGYKAATNISDEQMEEYLMLYDDYAALETDEQRAAWKAANKDKVDVIKGNLGVLHFAEDAVGRDADEVLSNVKNYIDVLSARGDDEAISDLTAADFEAYYQKTLSGDALAAFLAKDPEDREAEVNANFRYKDGAAVALGTLELSAEQLVAMDKAAAGGSTNTTGVTTLGSMYALAAGYFKSDTYKNSDDYMGDGVPLDFTDFSHIVMISELESFDDYVANEGKADLQAYLDFMSYASSGNVDVTNPDAFAGEYDYFGGALGYATQNS